MAAYSGNLTQLSQLRYFAAVNSFHYTVQTYDTFAGALQAVQDGQADAVLQLIEDGAVDLSGCTTTNSIVAARAYDDYDALHQLADAALYQAKGRQKDQYCLAQRDG